MPCGFSRFVSALSQKLTYQHRREPLKIYLVGGAVRDKLLGRPVTERDWVVVGANVDTMQAQGFRQVGRDFPVFLHPETGEEYALARTERKRGHGYGGFVVHASEEVTLEEDLARRDLTINAIAEDANGQTIDPFGGQADLSRRMLRHVSPAFAEDPLRVLRTARFAARYHHLGFHIAPETLALMTELSISGELNHLTAERIWQELSRALMECAPSVFLSVLEQCHALKQIFPELAALRGVPQPADHHPEVDTLTHQYLVLDQCAIMQLPLEARFAALVHDLGKGTTPVDEWPKHIGHEKRGAKIAAQVATRLKAPNDCRDMGVLTATYHTQCHTAFELRPSTIFRLLAALDTLRRPERLHWFLGACEADARGRQGFSESDYPQARFLQAAAQNIQAIDVEPFIDQGFSGPQLGEKLRDARIRAIAHMKTVWTDPAC